MKVKVKKEAILKYGAGWIALVFVIGSFCYTRSVDYRSDLRDRAQVAFEDLEKAIATVAQYESEGAILTKEQHEALTSAATKKREARAYKNSGKYRDSVKAANDGITILEHNFPTDKFPKIYYPPRENGGETYEGGWHCGETGREVRD